MRTEGEKMSALQKGILVLILAFGFVGCEEEESVSLGHYGLLTRDSDFICSNLYDKSLEYFVSLGSEALLKAGISTNSESVFRIDVYNHVDNAIKDLSQTTLYLGNTYLYDDNYYFISESNLDIKALLDQGTELEDIKAQILTEREEMSNFFKNFSAFGLSAIALKFEPNQMQISGLLGSSEISINCKTLEQL